jgi:ApaG protein
MNRALLAGCPERSVVMSSARTHGILVTVVSQYIPERSSVSSHQFAFAYTVRIANQGSEPAQLRSRHWIITDSDGRVQEVRGEGVVGEQPLIRPGAHFEYTSWCVIDTASGSMRGTYHMVRPDGEDFDAEIAPFRLGLPQTLN